MAKKEKLERFEDLFHTLLKMQPEMTVFHANLQKEALRTLRNISASNKINLNDVLIEF